MKKLYLWLVGLAFFLTLHLLGSTPVLAQGCPAGWSCVGTRVLDLFWCAPIAPGGVVTGCSWDSYNADHNTTCPDLAVCQTDNICSSDDSGLCTLQCSGSWDVYGNCVGGVTYCPAMWPAGCVASGEECELVGASFCSVADCCELGSPTNTPTPGGPTPTPTPTPPPPLGCPSGFSVNCNASGTNVTIDWNNLSGAVKYMIRANADPVGDWFGPGDLTDEPISSIYSFSVEEGRGYTYDVQGIRAGESYPYPGCRAPFDTFTCYATACDISATDVILSGVGGTGTGFVSVNKAEPPPYTIDDVLFTVNSPVVASITSANPDTASPFSADFLATSVGTSTYTATATMDDPALTQCSATANLIVNNPGAWWQVIGGDVIAGNTLGIGQIRSEIPPATTCSLPSCEPFLIRESNSYTGVPSLGGSITNYGSGTPSSTNWEAIDAPFLSTEPYSYSFFEARIPSTVIPTPLGPIVPDAALEGGGVSFGGYFWYSYDGGAGPLSLNAADGEISLGSRRVIVFVKGEDVTINAKISVDDGLGAFYLIADEDVIIDPSVGDAHAAADDPALDPDIEGLIFADGQIITGTEGPDLSGNGQDLQLYVRGGLTGLGLDGLGFPSSNGVVFERDLPDNAGFPGEIIEFAPDMALSWPPYLTSRTITWREVAP